MKKKIGLLLILIQTLFVVYSNAQTAAADTNRIAFKNITVTGDRSFDVKKVSAAITEGFDDGVRKYQLVSLGAIADYSFPMQPGLYHLLITYDKLNASILFMYRIVPGSESITLHFYKEGKLMLCKVTSKLSDDMNKVVILQ